MSADLRELLRRQVRRERAWIKYAGVNPQADPDSMRAKISSR